MYGGFGPVTGAAAGTTMGAATPTYGAPMHGVGHAAAPLAGCGYGAMPVGHVAPGYGAGSGFTLIIVLFILLVIIGASWATPAV
ncbi:YjcZ family sporulation protein [Anaerobacillus sp. CMMVII]|uniref:YjcZ family sporulation protein n=1 Tax=Anaerobacillus sp. CMMVII TaxID=2755588 RepID=UPI0028E0A343|nr:YjcZ family sporulation protein [Anaerobacillus sp. CMMVII]